MKIASAGITMKNPKTINKMNQERDPSAIYPLNLDFVKYVEEVKPETTIGDLTEIEEAADIFAKERFLFMLHNCYGFTVEQAQRIDEILCPEL